MIKKAFVLGAGLGTRLRPLTEDLPKPFLPVFQKPLITFALDHLIACGVESFVINTHHLADQFQLLFGDGFYRRRPVTLVYEPVLLETGGGIKNAEHWLGDEPFLVYSGDILTDLKVETLLEEHRRKGNDVTLALRQTGLAAGVSMEDGRITAITRDAGRNGCFDYANVSVWNPGIFARIPAAQKTSFIPVLLEWMRDGGRIGGIALEEGRWFNVGSRREYLDVHRTIARTGWKPAYLSEEEWPSARASSAKVEPGASVTGCSVLGEDCRVGSGAILEDTIVWPGAQIASRSDLRGCIVRTRKSVEGTHRDADL